MPLCLEVWVCAHEDAELLDRVAMDAQQMPNGLLTMWRWPLLWTRGGSWGNVLCHAAAATSTKVSASIAATGDFVAATVTLPRSLPARLAGGCKADDEAADDEQPHLYTIRQ